MRILINNCNTIYRQRSRMVVEESIPEAWSREEGYANAEWESFLNCLDEKYRTVIVLYYVQGFKTREIAEILDVNENTVRGRLVTARKRLGMQYTDDGGKIGSRIHTSKDSEKTGKRRLFKKDSKLSEGSRLFKKDSEIAGSNRLFKKDSELSEGSRLLKQASEITESSRPCRDFTGNTEPYMQADVICRGRSV